MRMSVEDNVKLRQALRIDHLQYGRVVFVPEDIPAEVMDDLVKAGLVRSVVKAPAAPGRAMTPEESAAAAAARAEERIFVPPPSSVQMLVQSVGAGTSGNGVSPGRNGPTKINHVQAFTYADGGALNVPQRFGVNIVRSPDVGPFAGDITVFEFYDPQNLFGFGEGQGEIFFKQRVDTAVGSRVYPLADFFPHMIIPFSPFYVNVSVANLNHPATVFVTVDFAPIDVPRGVLAAVETIEPRPVAPAPMVAAARAAPRIETREFFGFARIKEFEALGNRVVWPTIRAVPGRPGWSSVSVVVR